ncbi:TetR/AcrR family transcriptional regulator [Kitasatospora sp. NPDC054939]
MSAGDTGRQGADGTAGSGRGTGSGSKGEQRRAALLDTAEALLIDAGSAELSMRAVASAAGVRLGHLQYYFPARADLVAALLDRILRRSEERLLPLLATVGAGSPTAPAAADPTPTDRTPTDPDATHPAPTTADAADAADPAPADPADALVTALLADQDDPRLVRLFAELWALAARDEAVARAVRAFYAGYREKVAAFLAERVPGLPEEVYAARAQVFLMLIEGAALFRSGLAGERDPGADEVLARTARSVLAG